MREVSRNSPNSQCLLRKRPSSYKLTRQLSGDIFVYAPYSRKQGFSYQDKPGISCCSARWEALRANAGEPVLPGSLSRPTKVGRLSCCGGWQRIGPLLQRARAFLSQSWFFSVTCSGKIMINRCCLNISPQSLYIEIKLPSLSVTLASFRHPDTPDQGNPPS